MISTAQYLLYMTENEQYVTVLSIEQNLTVKLLIRLSMHTQ